LNARDGPLIENVEWTFDRKQKLNGPLIENVGSFWANRPNVT